MKRRSQNKVKEMISTVDLSHTDVVAGTGLGNWQYIWHACMCLVAGHDAPPRQPGQWRLCRRCGKLVGEE